MAPQSSYLHAFSYSDMPLGVEKVSRSKVLPNEVRFVLIHVFNTSETSLVAR